MGELPRRTRMTYAEYLAAEAKAEVRHEFLNGEQRRTEGGRWERLEAPGGETIELASLGVTLDVAAVYANPLEPGRSGESVG